MSEWKKYTSGDEQIAEILLMELKKRLDYDPVSGSFTWIYSDGIKYRAKAGSFAGSIKPYRSGTKYLTILLLGKRHYAHRLAWLYVHGSLPSENMCIDHIDGDGLNNSITNLRVVDKLGNSKNRRITSKNKSGKLGVFFASREGKWAARIGVNGNKKHLGYFEHLKDAIEARERAEINFNFHSGHGKRIAS